MEEYHGICTDFSPGFQVILLVGIFMEISCFHGQLYGLLALCHENLIKIPAIKNPAKFVNFQKR